MPLLLTPVSAGTNGVQGRWLDAKLPCEALDTTVPEVRVTDEIRLVLSEKCRRVRLSGHSTRAKAEHINGMPRIPSGARDLQVGQPVVELVSVEMVDALPGLHLSQKRLNHHAMNGNRSGDSIDANARRMVATLRSGEVPHVPRPLSWNGATQVPVVADFVVTFEAEGQGEYFHSEAPEIDGGILP